MKELSTGKLSKTVGDFYSMAVSDPEILYGSNGW